MCDGERSGSFIGRFRKPHSPREPVLGTVRKLRSWVKLSQNDFRYPYREVEMESSMVITPIIVWISERYNPLVHCYCLRSMPNGVVLWHHLCTQNEMIRSYSLAILAMDQLPWYKHRGICSASTFIFYDPTSESLVDRSYSWIS